MSVPYGVHRYLACHGIIGRSSGDLSTIYRGAYVAGHVVSFASRMRPRSIRFVEGHSLPVSIPRPDNIVLPEEPLEARFFCSISFLVFSLFLSLSFSPSRFSRERILCHPIKVHYLSSYRVFWPWSWHASADTIGPLDHPIAAQCTVARQPNWPAWKKGTKSFHEGRSVKGKEKKKDDVVHVRLPISAVEFS